MPRDHRPARSVRVLLAEDGSVGRGALAVLLQLAPDLRVVAQVPAGADVVAAALTHRPDVALVDAERPGPHGTDGVDVAVELRDQAPDCRVLILATAARPGLLERALAAGAAGFLIKDGPVNDLVTAVRQVLTGETVVDPALTSSGAYGSMVRPQGRTTEGPPCPP
jgi:two-component system response regulator DesR